MIKVQDDKRRKINEITSVVKLASLLLTAIIIYNNIFKKNDYQLYLVESYYAVLIIFILTFALLSIYFIWSFSTKNKLKCKKCFNVIEIIFFISLFSSIIFFSGSYLSEYKFIFLFIIITATIQQGMKWGMIIASVSSSIILFMDIIMAPKLIINTYFETDLILAGIFILTAWTLGYYVKVERSYTEKLENVVNIDGLTELYNHRFFHEILHKQIKEADEEKKLLSLIFIDIDYFKHYNDLYGHQKGDYVLKLLARIIKNSIRSIDIAARYGGEEFAIILPNTDENEAVKIAEKIRINIEKEYFEGEENQPFGKITASIGVSVYPKKAKSDMELIKSADDALYRAKFFDKNRVEIYTSILDDIKENIEEKDIELVASIKTLISVINAKDKYTYGHVERVVIYSKIIAKGLNLSEEDKRILVYGAYLHDIGKINIPKEILNKQTKLTNEEWEQLKEHPANGVEIIKSVESLKKVIPLILNHHERFDGLGYPRKLRGENIPYLARVLTVLDSFDAMTSSRLYNVRKTYEEAFEEIEKCKGAQFDPEIAEAFIKILREQSTNEINIDNMELI